MLNIKGNIGWSGMVDINNVWDNLMDRGIITVKERERVKLLSLEEQQIELKKYKEFRVKNY